MYIYIKGVCVQGVGVDELVRRGMMAHLKRSYTSHPTPCTLHPAPHTLHPKLCTLTRKLSLYYSQA